MSEPILDYSTPTSPQVERWWVAVLCVGLVIAVLGGLFLVIWWFWSEGLGGTIPISAKP
jgi:hypothetical protein